MRTSYSLNRISELHETDFSGSGDHEAHWTRHILVFYVCGRNEERAKDQMQLLTKLLPPVPGENGLQPIEEGERERRARLGLEEGEETPGREGDRWGLSTTLSPRVSRTPDRSCRLSPGPARLSPEVSRRDRRQFTPQVCLQTLSPDLITSHPSPPIQLSSESDGDPILGPAAAPENNEILSRSSPDATDAHFATKPCCHATLPGSQCTFWFTFKVLQQQATRCEFTLQTNSAVSANSAAPANCHVCRYVKHESKCTIHSI